MPVPGAIIHVVLRRAIGEIDQSVVVGVSIQMPADMPFRARTDKSPEHQKMNLRSPVAGSEALARQRDNKGSSIVIGRP